MTVEEIQAAANDVWGELKDFQQKTVDHIIDMYVNKGTSRFLVSDEVGLGKTMIARGVLSKLAEEYAKKGKTEFNAVYFCSNANIIMQNLRKLCFCNEMKPDKKASASDLRITMQSRTIYNQQKDATSGVFRIHLIPLTPGTSIKISYSAGTNKERKLIFNVIGSILEDSGVDKSTIDSFRDIMRHGTDDNDWDDDTYDTDYIIFMKNEINNLIGNTDCRFKSVEDFIDLIKSDDPVVFDDDEREFIASAKSDDDKSKKINKLKIGCLRHLFAQISLNMLKPDLVVMDEFQRFKDLLEAKLGSSTEMLMTRFINGSDQKILLLSATPFKPFVSSDHIDDSKEKDNTDDSDSLADFYSVIEFLKKEDDYHSESLETHTNNLTKLKTGNLTDLEAVKQSAKDVSIELYDNICRTDRLSDKDSLSIHANIDMNAMKTIDKKDIGLYPDKADIIRFLEADKLAKYAETSLPIDYSNSTPYILSFALTSEYDFKKKIEEKIKTDKEHRIIEFDPKQALWIDKNIIDAKKAIPCKSAKLQKLMETVLPDDKKVEQLLWIPPSRPYYAPQGLFAEYYDKTKLKTASAPTKTIVFSRYRMVPRMIALMISYEAERRIGNNKEPNTNDIRKLLLTYPSEFLSNVYKPSDSIGKTIEEIRNDIKNEIGKKLKDFIPPVCDEKYILLFALLLLDCNENSIPVNDNEYTDYLQKMIGKKQPVPSYIQDCNKSWDDLLINDLADLAIASPAVCYHRMLNKYTLEPETAKAKNLAEKLVKYLSNPMSSSVLNTAYSGDQPFWKKVLNYCLDGNIQAVLDEYSHVISDSCNKSDEKAKEVAEQMDAAMEYHSKSLKIDTMDNFEKRINKQKEDDVKISYHYATSVIENDSSKDKDGEETSNPLVNKMNAFNSPFRPFVLASTSIGQEGLDFHKYCRRLVHWNLPANPIDLEQREGRIDRYKNLAIRQNIAVNFGSDEELYNTHDVWTEMFDKANQNKPEGCSDLIPYWVLWDDDRFKSGVKIESLYPLFKFSKEVELYKRLDYLKTICRIAMGQSDQEELLTGIIKNFPEIAEDPEAYKDLFIDISPLNQEKRNEEQP